MIRRLPFSAEAVAIGILAAVSGNQLLHGVRDLTAKAIALGLNRIIWEKGLEIPLVTTYGTSWEFPATQLLQGLVGLTLAGSLLLWPDKQKASAAAEAPRT